jgi:RNA polymerase sigma-70 factor, ECF subfamily
MMSTVSLSLARTQGKGAHTGAVALGGLLHPSAKNGSSQNGSSLNGKTVAARNADATIDTELGPQKVNMTRPPKEVSDHELLQRFQQGDEDGYVELYLRRQAEVFTFALRLAAGDRDFASDLFQETFIKVYRKAHTFRAMTDQDGVESANVLGWLYKIVRTTYLNHKRQRALVGLDESHDNIQSTDRSLQPEFREEQSTLKERVEAAILSLPIEIREPFILREFDGMSYQEISEQLNITLGGVRQRIYRAKLAMREQLMDLVHDDFNN